MVEERMLCPVCQLELGVEHRAGELAVTYGFKDFRARCLCRDRGDPVFCGHLLPTILQELPESKVAPLRSRAHAKEEKVTIGKAARHPFSRAPART
jgi:hypothetical protein